MTFPKIMDKGSKIRDLSNGGRSQAVPKMTETLGLINIVIGNEDLNLKYPKS